MKCTSSLVCNFFPVKLVKRVKRVNRCLKLIIPSENEAFVNEHLICNFAGVGDSGQGMTGGTIAGILIKDMIMGKENPWSAAYSPSRKLPISKSTVAGVGEEAQHTIQVFYSRFLQS